MDIECPDDETDWGCIEAQRKQNFLLEAMDAISDAFYILDMNWRFVFINRAAEKFFHTDRKAAIGGYFLEVWPEVRDSEVFHTLTRVFAERQPVEQDLWSARRPDRHVCFSAVPLSSGGVGITVKDITHRSEYQNQMAAASLRLNSMLESTSDNVILLDKDGVIEFANARARESIGHGDDIVGKQVADVVPSLKGSPLSKMFAESIRTMATSSVTHYSSTYDRWYDITVYPSERGLSVFYRDISEQKRSEEQVSDNMRQYRELAESMPQMVWHADRGGNREWFNKRWLQYTGMTLRQARGWGWVNVHHPDDQEAVIRMVREGLRTKEPWEGTWRVKSKDGTYGWFLLRAVPVKDSRGVVQRWIGTKTDITAAIKDKEHQELLLHELNHRVKNTLAIIQSIGRNTSSENMPDFRKLFESRLLALSKTHDLLTESDWNSAPLRGLIESEMAPYITNHQVKPYTLLGPDINLKPQVVVPLGMALHELATNAVKYGAFSIPPGHVVINWNIDNDGPRTVIRLLWTESAGPPVTPPTRKGFGTRLMRHSFQGDFGGSVEMLYLPEGFQCIMEIPAEHIVDDNTVRTLFRIKKSAA